MSKAAGRANQRVNIKTCHAVQSHTGNSSRGDATCTHSTRRFACEVRRGGVAFGNEVHTWRMPVDANRRGTFGQLLWEYRHRAALSQELLAERAGLSLRGIQDLERGIRDSHTRARSAGSRTLSILMPRTDVLLEAARPSARSRASGHLGPPTPLTRFVGRQHELKQLSDQLLQSRLLTLTGPGGIGKTRLALELARDWPTDRGQVTVCELAAARALEQVAQSLAESLEVIERPVSRCSRPCATHLVRARHWSFWTIASISSARARN